MPEGAIADRASAQLPITWAALANATQYGPGYLDNAIDFVKFQVNTTVVDPADEGFLYNPVMLTYMGKMVAMQVIPGGIDFWGDQPSAETATGTNESITWFDRRDALQRLYSTLANEVRELAGQIELVVGRRTTRRGSMPAVSRPTGWVTPDAAQFQGQRGLAGGQ